MRTTRPNRQRHQEGFAVTRCYQPTRIERELLTQVFDLVQRSSAVDSGRISSGPVRVATGLESPSSSLPSDHCGPGSLTFHQRELEPAA